MRRTKNEPGWHLHRRARLKIADFLTETLGQEHLRLQLRRLEGDSGAIRNYVPGGLEIGVSGVERHGEGIVFRAPATREELESVGSGELVATVISQDGEPVCSAVIEIPGLAAGVRSFEVTICLR